MLRTLLLLAVLVGIASPAQAFFGGVRFVSHDGNEGPGSFRAAIDAANDDDDVRAIFFRRGLSVDLETPVVYSGDQSLSIYGNGSELVGDPAATPAPTWDAGLLASTGGANLTVFGLDFIDSFNNGLGVFVPGDRTGTIRLILRDVKVSGARFHGVFFDGQITTGFNTDDVIHPDCEDPYPVNSDAKMVLIANGIEILDNGTLAGGFNTGEPFEVEGETFLTGCPADFDGVRADNGGVNGIQASITRATVDGNLADGIELDDFGDGGVSLFMAHSQVNGNGETGTDDLDDGVDIDEADGGDLVAYLVDVSIEGNRDEGIDFDEAGDGDAIVVLYDVTSNANEDEGFKVDEEDDGNLLAKVFDSEINDSLSQDGVQLEEQDAGDLDALFVRTDINGNDNDAIDAEQDDDGVGTLKAFDSDFTGNGNPSLDLSGVDETLVNTLIDEETE